MVFRHTLGALGGVLLCSLLAIASAQPAETRARLTVHEWGTFTSVVGREGKPVAWRPLDAPRDLPRFVNENVRNGKSKIVGTVRMETPVLYFYADRETSLSVAVDFPLGRITEWYPHAERSNADTTVAWKDVTVQPGSPERFPVDRTESHYYAARATDAAPLLVRSDDGASEREKMLFYRGVGTFDLPLAVSLDGGLVSLSSAPGGPTRAIVVESRGGQVGFGAVDLTGGAAALARPEPAEGGDAGLRAAVGALLEADGLYAREARAMIDTWADTWTDEGLRVFFVVPRATTDSLLPLRVDPAPDEVVRVLVGRVEIIRPETEAEVEALVRRLAGPPEQSADALGRLSALGPFEGAILRYLAARDRDGLVARLLLRHRPEVFRDF